MGTEEDEDAAKQLYMGCVNITRIISLRRNIVVPAGLIEAEVEVARLQPAPVGSSPMVLPGRVYVLMCTFICGHFSRIMSMGLGSKPVPAAGLDSFF